jgi:hypothetical protein
MNKLITFNGNVYDARHGGPFDRGSADSWYDREIRPHFFTEATYQSDEITEQFMTKEQIDAYMAGYEYNEQIGGKKAWD